MTNKQFDDDGQSFDWAEWLRSKEYLQRRTLVVCKSSRRYTVRKKGGHARPRLQPAAAERIRKRQG